MQVPSTAAVDFDVIADFDSQPQVISVQVFG
jgi:hypothetical protein